MSKNKNNDGPPWWVIVLVIVIIIITVGWALGWFVESSDSETLEVPESEEEKRLKTEEAKKRENELLRQKLLKEKNERLVIVNALLIVLNRKKVEISLKEKRYYRQARRSLALLIILLNGIYTYIYNFPMELDPFLDFNELILLAYSFFAFITFGTPSGLIRGLKEKVALYLKNKNIHTIEEIEALTREKEILIKEIEDLKQASE